MPIGQHRHDIDNLARIVPRRIGGASVWKPECAGQPERGEAEGQENGSSDQEPRQHVAAAPLVIPRGRLLGDVAVVCESRNLSGAGITPESN